MNRIIQDVKIYEGKYSCLFSSLRNIFLNQGYQLSESDVYFICNGPDFQYDSQLTSYVWYYDLKELLSNTERNGFCRFQYISAEEYGREMENMLLDAIRSNTPALMFVKAGGLKYHKIFKQAANYIHSIMLYGFDEEQQQVYILDPYFIDQTAAIVTFKGPVPVRELLGCMKAAACFLEIKAPDFKMETIFAAARDSIRKHLDNSCPQGGVCRGNNALKKYISDFKRLTDMDVFTFGMACSSIYYS